MPFVYDFDKPGNEDVDVNSPKRDDFVYLAPPDFGGARAPVHFSMDPPAPPPQQGFIDRLLGRRAPPPQYDFFSSEMRVDILPALQQLGMIRAYCRYDGGNDEGFAWLEAIETRSGERYDVPALVMALSTGDIPSRLLAAYRARVSPGFNTERTTGTDLLQEALRYELASLGAEMLLGSGFGTGAYYMYGAFTMDYGTMTISDDPNAAPVVENITVKM